MDGSRGAHSRALTLLQGLWLGGVRDVVLAPGSRSAPLALALHAADSCGDLRLHVRADERSASFLALGLATGSRRPVAVVTTSGTAVGNLLPAVMEAHHTGRPLIVVSADRPDRLRGTGANQTTSQAGIFGAFAHCHDLLLGASPEEIAAAAASACTTVGPSQLNLQLDGELLPIDPDPATWWTRPRANESFGAGGGFRTGAGITGDGSTGQGSTGQGSTGQGTTGEGSGADAEKGTQPAPEALALGPRTVVVAGDDAGPAARLLAEAANWPLLAEPTSGARVGRQAIRTYRLLLGTSLRDDIERVVVVGHPTLSRPVTALISDPGLEIVSVRDRTGTATDPGRVARHLDAVPTVAGADDPEWFDRWRLADDELSKAIDDTLGGQSLNPLTVASVLGRAVTGRTTLVVGSSNAVRDLDVMSQPWPPHEHRFVVGNRGLAGIDGTVSTALGIALGRQGARRTIAYLGDLTFLHDANGLLIGPDEPRPDITFVVLNDDGGAIFATLEQGAGPYAVAFERVFAVPHGTDLAALCAAHGVAHERVTQPERLEEVLGSEPSGIRVIEVRVSRSDRRADAARLRELALEVCG